MTPAHVLLAEAVAKNCDARGASAVQAGDKAARPLTLWLAHLRGSRLTGTADILIDATLSAMREVVACSCLGLVRPALNSMRLQIDLSLAWLFFKDHRVEWGRVQTTGEGFKMKSEHLRYLTETHAGFAPRFRTLSAFKTRTIEDPYRLLSAHMHGQSEPVLPKVTRLADVVASEALQDQAVQLQIECSEYIGDIFWSAFAEHWAEIPKELLDAVSDRFPSEKQRAKFFSDDP